MHQFSFIAGIIFTMAYAVDYQKLFNHNMANSDNNRWIFSVLRPFDEVIISCFILVRFYSSFSVH